MKWTLETARASLKQAGIRVGAEQIEYASTDGVGIKLHGAIDFLRKQHGYSVVVSNWPPKWNLF